jgi:CBS domain-containing protein
MARLTASAYMAVSTAHGLLRRLFPAPPRLTLAGVLAARRPERRRVYRLPASTSSSHDVLRLMLEEEVTAVVLDDEAGTPAAIMTTSDFLRRVALPLRDPARTPAVEVATPFSLPVPAAAGRTQQSGTDGAGEGTGGIRAMEPLGANAAASGRALAYAFPDNSVESAMEMMAAVRCHHLPVFDDEPAAGGRLVAVVSLPELLGLSRELREKRAAAHAARVGVGVGGGGGGAEVGRDGRQVDVQPGTQP